MKRPDTSISERERRREDRVAARFPLEYFFIHASEQRHTKQFRRGHTHNVSPHGVFFEADVVDPSIIPLAMQGEIQIAVRVTAPDLRTIEGTTRLAWAEPVKADGKHRFFVGVEYLDVSEGDAKYLYDAACDQADR
ncbi:MAG: PilZ domain-containing protein [Planctomycetes bacterium]|nr:PilZ domain-containing protein [Planctomycetota bacterium]NUQ33654.1 PilZ domain-containing protein [Planctomycetaceae bacterium]